MTFKCYIFNKVSWGEEKMKKVLLTVMNVCHWEKHEKSFVISMILMGLFNLCIVSFMLYHN
jgi:hypothetical protein